VKIGRVFPDLLTPLGAAGSVEEGLARTLSRLVRLTASTAGILVFRPPRASAVVVTAGARRLSASDDAALRALVSEPVTGVRLSTTRLGGRTTAVLRAPLGEPRRPVGELALLGRPRVLTRATLPAGFPRELGTAIGHVWHLHRRTLRISVMNEITRLLVSSDSLDDVLLAFMDGVARLVTFDGLSMHLVDAERAEVEIIDVPARSLGLASQETRVPLPGTLMADVVAAGVPLNVPDLSAARVPPAGAAALSAEGYQSAMLVPLVSGGGVFGGVVLAATRKSAFDDGDVETVAELARPLASAIEQRRLLDESRRRAEELAALYSTSQLITARLDVPSVLERISRSVSALIGASGCGIGLLDAAGTQLVHAAAHGFQSEDWRALTLPVGEGIMGRCAASGTAILVDDVRADARSARRDVDEREGIRSMLCIPLRVAGTLLGVISAFSTRPAFFSAHHRRVLEAFAEQAGIAVQNAQLFEESVRRTRETRALLEAGRAVTASLDPERTMRVIMEQARAVLGVQSCGIMSRDPGTGELTSVASLDLPEAMIARVRIREGEGITGQAVAERRPVQSADLFSDPRVRFPDLPRASGLRSMLAAPLRVGDRARGAIVVFRRDVHHFSAAEEELLLALADQAAIALDHAQLYGELETMVQARTRELDRQRRFVEVVLEALPLGVFVLDDGLRVVRANPEGTRVLAWEAGTRAAFPSMLPAPAGADVERFLRQAFATRAAAAMEREMPVGGEPKMFRLSVAPLGEGDDGGGAHVVLLVEDVTRAKQLERQMLLTERLTTAGRLAAGVAHELNNPLATIAGCAESLQSRLKEAGLAARPELADFPHYLGLIEEEAFRCKEITGSLLQFVREPGSRRSTTDVNALVLKTIELLSHQSRFADSDIVTDLDPALPAVVVNEGQLRQVFLGIAANALEAMEGRGRLTIRSRRGRDEIHIEFEDEGPGIPEDIAGRVFDPFFTTKPPGQGTGLGLAIAQGIVADHGGRIELRAPAAGGTMFRVVLPE
jgi:GAF domain-containing protein/nitrogen-specific signal transduction histidine kinase